jgi:hypothetical protein
MAREQGVPAEEAVTPELVEEAAIGVIELVQAEVASVREEHITDEDMERWMNEAFERLYPQYRPDGVPENVVAEAVSARMMRERAAFQLWMRCKRRRKRGD